MNYPPLPKPVAYRDRQCHFDLYIRNLQGNDLEPLHTADQMRAYVDADRAQRIPEGYVLVPVEPTEEMCAAAITAICYGPEGGFTRVGGPHRCWSDMIAAAPKVQP